MKRFEDLKKGERKMKIDDLMIDDWVLTESGVPAQFKGWTETFNKPVHGHKYRRLLLMYNEVAGSWEPDSSIQPIPLTEDILQKIWFRRYNNLYYLDSEWHLDIENHAIGIYNDAYESPKFIKQFTVKYVHELQHFLKMAKIEKEFDLYALWKLK